MNQDQDYWYIQYLETHNAFDLDTNVWSQLKNAVLLAIIHKNINKNIICCDWARPNIELNDVARPYISTSH